MIEIEADHTGNDSVMKVRVQRKPTNLVCVLYHQKIILEASLKNHPQCKTFSHDSREGFELSTAFEDWSSVEILKKGTVLI